MTIQLKWQQNMEYFFILFANKAETLPETVEVYHMVFQCWPYYATLAQHWNNHELHTRMFHVNSGR